MSTEMEQFDFGENWTSFSRRALNPERIAAARQDFADLFAGVPLDGAAFLDIGFGQGLGLFLAKELGARVTGCDINPKCRDALLVTASFFPEPDPGGIPLVIGSILEDDTLARLRAAGGFDVVHSWGVLHHTGAMREAIRRAVSLVKPSGHFVLAIYNTHWSSPVWTTIKRGYVRAPRAVQKLMIAAFVPVIWTAKLLVTRKNPFRQQRGMDFYHDVVDWVGGYPYEHATPDEIREFLAGFELVRCIPAEVPTGCNQFVFRRKRGDTQ